MTSRGDKFWQNGSIPIVEPEVLGDIISSLGDIGIFISDMGHVISVICDNNHPSFGDISHWTGRDIRDFLTPTSTAKLDSCLDQFVKTGVLLRAIELNHADREERTSPIRYTFHQVGPDGTLLMLGRDLQPIAEMQQQLVEAQIALERDYEAQRESETRLRVILDSATDAFLFVSPETGRIVDANSAAAARFGSTTNDLIGSNVATPFANTNNAAFLDRLNRAAGDSGPVTTAEIRRNGHKMQLHPRIFRAAGQRMLLIRIVPDKQTDIPRDSFATQLKALFANSTDAIVFADLNGSITSANDAFLTLIDQAEIGALRGKALSEYFARGEIDNRVLIDNARRDGQVRQYSTKLVADHGGQIGVEISATYLADPTFPAMAFVLRDTDRVGVVGQQNSTDADGDRKVAELVGSASLKEIVGDTTDVVEKMCIETALKLTGDNRVAAAEMLGLSRQSLYVKLRKFGLLGRDGA